MTPPLANHSATQDRVEERERSKRNQLPTRNFHLIYGTSISATDAIRFSTGTPGENRFWQIRYRSCRSKPPSGVGLARAAGFVVKNGWNLFDVWADIIHSKRCIERGFQRNLWVGLLRWFRFMRMRVKDIWTLYVLKHLRVCFYFFVSRQLCITPSICQHLNTLASHSFTLLLLRLHTNDTQFSTNERNVGGHQLLNSCVPRTWLLFPRLLVGGRVTHHHHHPLSWVIKMSSSTNDELQKCPVCIQNGDD